MGNLGFDLYHSIYVNHKISIHEISMIYSMRNSSSYQRFGNIVFDVDLANTRPCI